MTVEVEREGAAAAWDAGAQAATDWIKSGAWLATMPENPYRATCPSCGSDAACLAPPCPWITEAQPGAERSTPPGVSP